MHPDDLHAEVPLDYFESAGSFGLPVLFLPNTNACSAVFYQQIRFLSEKNVRAVSLTLPALFDPVSVVRALDVFVDQVLKWDGRFHIVGAGMGGYIAQLYCQMRAM